MNIFEIGPKIKALRKSKNMTQEELASKAKMAARALQRLEAGDGNPTLDTLFSLVDAMGYTLGDLLGSPRRQVAEAMAKQSQSEAPLSEAAMILEHFARLEKTKPLKKAVLLYLLTLNAKYLEALSPDWRQAVLKFAKIS